MKFFEYYQNNTGGSFLEDDKVCQRVVVEAKNSAIANTIAENLGIYFDGCADGTDCSCCGDRWYKQDDSDGIRLPYRYGNEIFKLPSEYFEMIANKYTPWTRVALRVFYDNGSIAVFKKKEAE